MSEIEKVVFKTSRNELEFVQILKDWLNYGCLKYGKLDYLVRQMLSEANLIENHAVIWRKIWRW